MAIDAIEILVQKVQDIWNDWQIARIVLIDVKGAFDHVLRAKLAQRMADLGIDDDLMERSQSFLTDRWVEPVIDGFINPSKCKIKTEIPQGSLVFPNLFLIYISGVFLKI